MREVIVRILEEINTKFTQYEGADFIEDGMIESMEIMDIVVRLEDEFGIEIGPEFIVPDYFRSVDTLVELVEKNKVS